MEFQPMSPDDIQRTMQFLLTQQAQFANDLETLTSRTSGIADAVIGLTGIVTRLAERQERTDEQLREMQARTDQRFAEVGDYIKNVEAHLNVVIDMFERHVRDDHGHKPS